MILCRDEFKQICRRFELPSVRLDKAAADICTLYRHTGTVRVVPTSGTDIDAVTTRHAALMQKHMFIIGR